MKWKNYVKVNKNNIRFHNSRLGGTIFVKKAVRLSQLIIDNEGVYYRPDEILEKDKQCIDI